MSVDLPAANEALILRLRLEFGLVSLEEIERWSDAKLLAADDPAFELIELSMARQAGRAEVLSLLRKLAGREAEADAVLLALAGAEPADLSIDELDRLFSHLEGWAASCAGEGSEASELLFGAYDVRDAIALAKDGAWGSLDSVREAATEFLKRARRLSTPKPSALSRGSA